VYDVPSYIWVFVLIGVVGITGTTSLVLYRSAVAARLGSASSLSIAAASATLLGGFVLATGLLANAGVYHEDSGQAAPFFGAAFATVLVASLLLARVPSRPPHPGRPRHACPAGPAPHVPLRGRRLSHPDGPR
jgi:hypothetical protein